MARLRTMAARRHIIIGDINCCRQRKCPALNECLQDNEWSDIVANTVTYQWNNYECGIYKILTSNGARAIAGKDEWLVNSDHAYIVAEVICQFQQVCRKGTDWEAVRSWAGQNQISREEWSEFDETPEYGVAHAAIRELIGSQWQRDIMVYDRWQRW